MHPTREAVAPLYGLVLVGGRSTRMGRDKSKLVYHGVAEWQRVRDLLGTVCERVLISVSPEQAERFSAEELVVDRWDGIGPMNGIASALREHEGVAFLVVACDMPGLDVETIHALVQARDDAADATVMVNEHGQFEPLCAVYEPDALPRLLSAIDAGAYSLNGMLADARVKRVTAAGADVLANVNTPEEASRHGADGVESNDGSSS